MSKRTPPTVFEYYNESPDMSFEQRMELSHMESRSGTELLWSAALHVDKDRDASRILDRLRDELIDEEDVLVDYKTMQRLRVNTAGPYIVKLPNGTSFTVGRFDPEYGRR